MSNEKNFTNFLGSSFHPLGMFFMFVILIYVIYAFSEKGSKYSCYPAFRGFEIGIIFLILQVYAYSAKWIDAFPVDNKYIGLLFMHGFFLLFSGLKKIFLFLISKEDPYVKKAKFEYALTACIIIFMMTMVCIYLLHLCLSML